MHSKTIGRRIPSQGVGVFGRLHQILPKMEDDSLIGKKGRLSALFVYGLSSSLVAASIIYTNIHNADILTPGLSLSYKFQLLLAYISVFLIFASMRRAATLSSITLLLIVVAQYFQLIDYQDVGLDSRFPARDFLATTVYFSLAIFFLRHLSRRKLFSMEPYLLGCGLLHFAAFLFSTELAIRFYDHGLFAQSGHLGTAIAAFHIGLWPFIGGIISLRANYSVKAISLAVASMFISVSLLFFAVFVTSHNHILNKTVSLRDFTSALLADSVQAPNSLHAFFHYLSQGNPGITLGFVSDLADYMHLEAGGMYVFELSTAATPAETEQVAKELGLNADSNYGIHIGSNGSTVLTGIDAGRYITALYLGPNRYTHRWVVGEVDLKRSWQKLVPIELSSVEPEFGRPGAVQGLQLASVPTVNFPGLSEDAGAITAAFKSGALIYPYTIYIGFFGWVIIVGLLGLFYFAVITARRSLARLWEIKNNSGSTLIVANDKGEITDANHRFFTMVGVKPSEINSNRQFHITDFFPEITTNFASAIAGPFCASFTDLNEQKITVEVRLTTDVFGSHTSFVIDATDITEHVLSYREIAAQQALLDGIISSTFDGILMVDTTLSIQFANASAHELLAYSPTNLIDRDLRTLLFTEQEDRVIGDLATVHELSTPTKTRAILRKSNGGVLVADMSISPIHSKGSNNGFVCVFSDGHEAMARQSQQEQRIAMLSKQSEDYTEIRHILSHDFIEPARTMRVNASLVEEYLSMGNTTQALDRTRIIFDGASRFLEMLDSFSKLNEAGREDMEVMACDIQSCIDEAIANVESKIVSTRATVHSSGENAIVWGSHRRVTLVFQNLIQNALKFVSSETNPIVSIERKIVSDREVQVRVSDNGIGVAEEHREIIFRPYTQINGDEYEGTGAGLGIVKKMLSHYDAKISVESSTPGYGTTFLIELKQAVAESTGDSAQRSAHTN